ncbi:formimidoyltransferase-cyclodeaminase-like [Schistocerca cancellata]|uniref:formimidoyltransferase-cyclodeaminase-like n=1 Tax=Schistocerca cancellata TaxID=274614 RepID=UPI00211836E5|nr:formimidoyltransferase-cyclodeaminase-like [Schistocerca cancellata]
MDRLVLCVPNFSEGRDAKTIEAISEAIKSTVGCTLLEVEPGISTNRTVVSFVGPPDAVVDGAVNAAKAAARHIDMASHTGSHPRLGAMDVCPLVPVQGITEEECCSYAERLALTLSLVLNIPVYLYGAASSQDYRKTVPQIRAGEYEGLEEKLEDPQWKPDYGPAAFCPKWGATMVGVRKFLLAYNINILGTKEQAHRIALNVRTTGRGADQPGSLKEVQGIGWWLEEENLAQVSLNITDFDVTPLHIAYEEVCKEAAALRVSVVGSELLGVVPLKAILQVAEYYIDKEDLFVLTEDQKVRLAINKLGLSELHTFNPRERILEYRMKDTQISGNLSKLTLTEFVNSVSARTPAPGGGSVSALLAALAAGLGTMVGQLTYGKRQFEAVDAEIRKIVPTIHASIEGFVTLIDKDSQAFDTYMEALKLPKRTEEEVQGRAAAMQKGLMKAIEIPQILIQNANRLWTSFADLAKVGNSTTISDLQVGAQCLRTAVIGASYNVTINLKNIEDKSFKTKTLESVKSAISEAELGCQKVLDTLQRRLNEE